MTPDEIERLVDEELARRKLGAAFDPPKNPWSERLRHPLVLAFFAFLFTTVIGGAYDQVLKVREDARIADERARENAKASAEAAVEGLETFSSLVFERQTYADLLRSAVTRGSGEEAVERKAAYDKLYVRWNAELTLNLRSLRSYLGDYRKRSVYEVAVEESIAKVFSRSDACLTRAYDIARRAQFPFPAPEVPADANGPCGTGDWTQKLRDERDALRQCMNAVLSNMIPQIQAQARRDPGVEIPPEAARAADRQIHQALHLACPGMPEAPPEAS